MNIVRSLRTNHPAQQSITSTVISPLLFLLKCNYVLNATYGVLFSITKYTESIIYEVYNKYVANYFIRVHAGSDEFISGSLR